MLRHQRMRRRGEPQTPAIDPEFAELIAGLYYAFEDNLERCARLTRATTTAAPRHRSATTEALAGARRIAYVQRVTFEAMAHVIDIRELPPGVLPIGVLSALARLAYALTALAEPEQDPSPRRCSARTRSTASPTSTRSRTGSLAREHNPDLNPPHP